MNMLKIYTFDGPRFEFRQVEKILSSPKIGTSSKPPNFLFSGYRLEGVVRGVKGPESDTTPLHPVPILGMGGINLHIPSPTHLHGAYRENFIF
jgi:hypothetical protein